MSLSFKQGEMVVYKDKLVATIAHDRSLHGDYLKCVAPSQLPMPTPAATSDDMLQIQSFSLHPLFHAAAGITIWGLSCAPEHLEACLRHEMLTQARFDPNDRSAAAKAHAYEVVLEDQKAKLHDYDLWSIRHAASYWQGRAEVEAKYG